MSTTPFAHPTAIVEPGAKVGEGTRVWHHAHIRDGATVGASCVIGKDVYVDAGAVVGDRVKLQNGVNVYAGVSIGDDVFVGPSATFTNDLVPRAFNADWTLTPTEVADGASIGANATIVCGNRLGAYSMVAAGATVTHPVEDHQLVGGVPARHLGWVCQCGQLVSREVDRPADLHCSACREHA